MIPSLPFKKSQRDGILLTGGFNRRQQDYATRAAQSRRDDTLLTVDFNLRQQDYATRAAQSRRDGILLTGGFNRRKETRHATSLQSPAGTAYYTCHICRPFGTWALFLAFLVRRLKPTVTQIPSLRDYSH